MAGDRARNALLDERLASQQGVCIIAEGLRAGPVDLNHVVPGEDNFHDPVVGRGVDPALRPPVLEAVPGDPARLNTSAFVMPVESIRRVSNDISFLAPLRER